MIDLITLAKFFNGFHLERIFLMVVKYFDIYFSMPANFARERSGFPVLECVCVFVLTLNEHPDCLLYENDYGASTLRF